jgi:hypothetical protein
MTLKKAVLRGLLGMPLGVFISTTIEFIYSLVYGELMVIPPVDGAITPLKAYAIQYIVSMVIGFVFAFGSAIFEVDRWSIAKQTVMHFLLTSLVFLPCSIMARWVDFNFISVLVYFIIFIIIYIAIWFIQYFSWKNKIIKLNRKLQEK